MRYFFTFLTAILFTSCAQSSHYVYEGNLYKPSPHVQLGESWYEGHGEIEAVINTVTNHVDEFQDCHNKHSKNRIAVGKVSVKYIVNRDGTVFSAHYKKETNIGNRQLRNCVVDLFREMNFSEDDLDMNSWTLWVHQDIEFSSIYRQSDTQVATVSAER